MRKAVATFIIALTLLVSMSASIGAGGFFIITWGEEIYEVGPMPGNLAKQYPTWNAGYKCSTFGVFWANIHVWDCEAVGVEGDLYSDDSSISDAVAVAYSMDDAQRGIWDKHGRWVLLAVLAFWVLISVSGSNSEDTRKK